jgi:hypothetical protein
MRERYTPKLPVELPVGELQVGDVVKWFDGAFGTAIVKQVTDKEVKLFRPYGTTAGFAYSNNQTICYTGTEEGTYLRDSKECFLVYQRGDVK